MLCLHYFWFLLFMRMLARLITQGKVDDLGNRVEKKIQ